MTENPQQPAQLILDAGRIVDAFGGVRPMAARLGIAATTVQGWKSRGNIPEARRQDVRDAAQAAGIDVFEIAEIATPDTATAAVEAPAAPSARALAWLALGAAAAAGIAVAMQALLTPQQSVDPSVGPAMDGLAARIGVLEAAPAPKLAPLAARIATLEAAPEPNLAPLAARIAALEAALKSLGEAAARQAATQQPATPDLAPRLDALAAQRNQDRDRLDSVIERLEALSAERQLTGQSESAAHAAELESMRAELAALRGRIDDAAGGSINASAASLVLAVTTLEDVVNSGVPFKTPLLVIERFSQNDAALAEFAALLSPHAGDGIPTQGQLVRDFQALAGQLSAPLWPQTGVLWIDGVLEKVDSLVTIRRLTDAEGKVSPIVAVERALAANDLPRAIAALAGMGGPAADWARLAKSRVDADRAMAGLRLRAIEALGQPTENTR